MGLPQSYNASFPFHCSFSWVIPSALVSWFSGCGAFPAESPRRPELTIHRNLIIEFHGPKFLVLDALQC